METSVQTQLFIFISGIISGGILGATYDAFRLQRHLFRMSKTAVAMQDILYWLLAAFFVLRVMLATNNGVVRAFELASIAIGGLLYLKFCSTSCSRILLKSMQLIHKLANLIIVIVAFPFLLIIKIFHKPCKLATQKARHQTQRFKRFAKRI